ncbi:hypothetical protein BJ170DRAFT_691885 [Xylariales sp. AK1849]|nr:hypothetical protein BJ170DRAFT_691885 [Xylariales sp. AK1849]
MSTTIFPTEVWIGADGKSSTMTPQTTTFTPAPNCQSGGGYDLPIGAETVNRLDVITDTIAVSAIPSCYPPGYGNSLANGDIGFGVPGTICISGWTSASSWTETSSSLVILACCPSSWLLVTGYSHWWNADCMTTLSVGQEVWHTPTTATQSRVLTALSAEMPARRNFFAAVRNMDATSTTQSTSSPTVSLTGSTAAATAAGSSSPVSTPSSQDNKKLSQGQIAGLSVGMVFLALCVIAAGIALFRRRKAAKSSLNLDDTRDRWDKSELPVQETERSELHDLDDNQDRWDKSELPVQEAERSVLHTLHDTQDRRNRSELPAQEAERSELHNESWEPSELAGEGLAKPVELPGGR